MGYLCAFWPSRFGHNHVTSFELNFWMGWVVTDMVFCEHGLQWFAVTVSLVMLVFFPQRKFQCQCSIHQVQSHFSNISAETGLEILKNSKLPFGNYQRRKGCQIQTSRQIIQVHKLR